MWRFDAGNGSHPPHHDKRSLQAYIQGISTRSVDDLVKALGMSGVSKSQVSRLCEEINDRVKAMSSRSGGRDEFLLWDLLEQFEPEDGLLWGYDIDDAEGPAFTSFGMENLREIIADQIEKHG